MSDNEHLIHAVGNELVVPLKPPFVELPTPKPDTVHTGVVTFKFPDQCAWCGSELVSGMRSVAIYEDNLAYESRAKRLLKEGVGLAVGSTIGGVAGVTTYGVLKPQDVAKVKGLALNMTVPHCADHAHTPSEDVFALVNKHIQVRDAAYAQLTARVNNPTIRLPTLENLLWPEQCVICSTATADQRYDAGEGGQILICATDLNKINRSRAANKKIWQTGFVVAFLVGGLTVLVNASLGGHVVLFLCIGLVGLGLWVELGIALASRMVGVKQMPWQPIQITRDGDHFVLTFQDAAMAELIRKVNNLTE